MNPCQSGFFSESPFFLTAGKSGAGFRRVTDTFRCSTPLAFPVRVAHRPYQEEMIAGVRFKKRSRPGEV